MKMAIEELVISTLSAQHAARRGLPDFALRAHGGRIALQLTTQPAGLFSSKENDPSIAIDDDVHAGKCWTINALPSQLGIRLPRMLHPTHITIEHLPTEIAVDIERAPRNLTLWGAVEGVRNKDIFANLVAAGLLGNDVRVPPLAKGSLWAPLVSFVYDIHSDNPVQTFSVSPVYLSSTLSVGVVALELSENWGGNSTCLYRVRIHGTPA